MTPASGPKPAVGAIVHAMSELSDRCGGRPWWLSDAPAFLREVATMVRLGNDATYLVAVDLEQRVLGVKKMPARKAAYERRTRLAYDVMAPALERMLPSHAAGTPPTGTGHLLRTRTGRVVPTPEDSEWDRALLYACGYICAYTGGVVLLTPNGWRF